MLTRDSFGNALACLKIIPIPLFSFTISPLLWKLKFCFPSKRIKVLLTSVSNRCFVNFTVVMLEMEGSVQQRYERVLFPKKNYKRALLIWAAPMFIVYLLYFWWNKFLKIKTTEGSIESQIWIWPRITPASCTWLVMSELK